MQDNRTLPAGIEKYAQSPVFSSESVPDSLLASHSTKGGTYGRIVVTKGAVAYFLKGSDEPLAQIHAGETFVILPTEEHFVRLTSDAEFLVEFCR